VARDWRDTLIELIVQRLTLAEDVAAGKFVGGQPIDDPIREQRILDSVAGVLREA
jgi:chorismate mutase